MLDVARLSEKDRSDLFRATAQKMRVDAAIVEKDFWVVWVLDYLFHHSPWQESLAFKGGTSLSKAYGAIERFSEDIDLILDWRLLGYSADEPWAPRSNKKQDAFGKQAVQKTSAFLATEVLPILQPALVDRGAISLHVDAEKESILVHYPKSFSLKTVLPQIRLEFGPMAEWVPNEPRPIRPYAADHFPDIFRHTETIVRTVMAERTFWEKVTILHQEAHRAPDSPLPPRYSRHYYDLHKLCHGPFRKKALEKSDLLASVVKFKIRFYHCAWAKYEGATFGTIRILPSKAHEQELRKDYRDMESMLFGDIPDFETLIESLSALESDINTSHSTPLPFSRLKNL